MDRHDVSPIVTAENVVELHQKNLKIQHLYKCRGLTYWFDEKRGTAFCLIEAPDLQSLQEMHARAHGEVPNQIIEVEANIVESFLGRIEDPYKSQNMGLNIIHDSAFRIIMVIKFPDIQWQDIPELHNNQWRNNIRKLSSRAEGRIVKQTKDYFLISFSSVSKAIDCALEIKRSIHVSFSKYAEKEIDLKIGLSAGGPVSVKDTFFEDAIKLAERLCDSGKNTIVISTEVKDLYERENEQLLNRPEDILFHFLPADEKLLTRLMDFMETSYSNAFLTVYDFTKSLGLSKSKLYRKIVYLTQKSLNPFIRDYRLNEAMNLLQKKTFSLSEIAYQTGFTSLSYFSKCFHRKYGKVPSALIRE